MRIAYMLTSLGIGGAERQIVALAESMAQRGHSVLLIVLLERQPEQWPTDVHVVHLDMRKTPVSIVSGLVQAGGVLRGFRPNLVHSHTYHANMTARVLRMLAAAPVVSTVHNVYEGGRLRMFAYRITDGLSVRTTAVSQAAADRYVQLKAVPAHKCSVITNAVDTAEFAPDAERRMRTRRELDAPNGFLWFAAGRIVPAKDLPNLLHAFALVRVERPDAYLWIAGDAMVTEFDRVSALAAELRLYPFLRWLGLRRDVPALLDAADAFVLSSAWEGMPLAVAEAMAMEKPVVATDVGGVRELVDEAGAIVRAKDGAALAETMLATMRQPEESRRALGRTARERIVQKFSMDARAVEWEAFYRGVPAR